MTAVAAMLELAKRLNPEERAELLNALADLDTVVADRPVVTREEIDRKLAQSIAEARRGELVDADEVLAELERS